MIPTLSVSLVSSLAVVSVTGRELLNTAKELGLNVIGVRYESVCVV